MQSLSTDKIEKIDFEDLIKDFRIVSVDELASYLKEIWKVNLKFKIYKICYLLLIKITGFISKKRESYQRN